MRQPQFIRSTTFHWALAVAGVLAVFVIVLFGFIYWKTDDYLIARSDTMIARQLNYLTGLSGERRLMAIDAASGAGFPRRSICRIVWPGRPQDGGQPRAVSARS